MDIDIDPIVEQANQKLKDDSLQAALDFLAPYEKQARNAADLPNSTKLLEAFINLCYAAGDWSALADQITHLSKKRGQLKQAITIMVQKAMTYIDSQNDKQKKFQLIDTLRTVTLGKIYVEVERAKLSKMISLMKESEGNLVEAADVLFELQVETFGSMPLAEKLDYLLDQMRLGLATKDYTRTQIISRKINVKFFDNPNTESQKAKYHEAMIQLALHDNQFLECAKHYLSLFDIESISDSHQHFLKCALIFVALAPYDNEQHDLAIRILRIKLLDSIPSLKNLLTSFCEKEIMRWPMIEKLYKTELSSTGIFDQTDASETNLWLEFKDRVIEHNIRIIAGYYRRITLGRLTQLLDIDLSEAEDTLSKLVVSKTIYARLDRPSGVVTFAARKNPDDILDAWSNKMSEVLDQVVKVNHLIAKEEMIHSISKKTLTQ